MKLQLISSPTAVDLDAAGTDRLLSETTPTAEGPEALEQQALRSPLRWPELATRQPPERRWAIKNWIGRGHVTLLAGPAGSGKTALAQLICSALAIGRNCIDEVSQPTVSLMWAGEDDHDEIWRREIPIARYLGVPLETLDRRLYVHSYSELDMTLAAVVQNRMIPTPLLRQLREQIGDYGAGFVVLDSVARIFGGNENDRNQVTTFVSLLTEALAPTGAAMLILGHPAKTHDSEYSGSGAWEASVRSRLYFGYRQPDADFEAEDAQDKNTRFLAKRKANYSCRDVRRVEWRDGCMQPAPGSDPSTRSIVRTPDQLVVEALRIIRALNDVTPAIQQVSDNHCSPYYIVKLAQKHRLLGGMSASELKVGVAEALRRRVLEVAVIGKRANGTPRLSIVEAKR